MSDDAQNLPTREEYIAGYHQHRQELADCVNNNTWNEDTVRDAPPTQEGLARKLGKPFGELSRGDQKMITSIVRGHQREIAENIKSLRQNNILNAMERLHRGNKWLAKMEPLIDDQFEAYESLHAEEVGVDTAYKDQDLKKTKAGNAVAQAKHIKRLQTMIKTQIECSSMIAKLEEKAASTFIREGDKSLTVNAITPDDIKSEFAEFEEVPQIEAES